MSRMYQIDKWTVMNAWKKVKENKGVPGYDEQTIEMFDKDLKGNLYLVWNRMSSGSYMASPVRKVEIPKENGKMRQLGIPTVRDRIAQTVVKMTVESYLDKEFHPDSYGYRPSKSAHQAVSQARERCFKYAWVVEIDIEGFFDNIPHEPLIEMIEKRVKEAWCRLYIKRWLKAKVINKDGSIEEKDKGTPQGGVISPFIANIFLDEVFDQWMEKCLPGAKFERYADDIIIHCETHRDAVEVMQRVKRRLEEYGLKINEEKSRIVYCKKENRKANYPTVSFTFLGYDFKPRKCETKTKEIFVGFTPAISEKGKKKIRKQVKDWRIHRKTSWRLTDIAQTINPAVRGWFEYYGKFTHSALRNIAKYIESKIMRWIKTKFKTKNWKETIHQYENLKKKKPKLFVHWKLLFGTTERAV